MLFARCRTNQIYFRDDIMKDPHERENDRLEDIAVKKIREAMTYALTPLPTGDIPIRRQISDKKP